MGFGQLLRPPVPEAPGRPEQGDSPPPGGTPPDPRGPGDRPPSHVAARRLAAGMVLIGAVLTLLGVVRSSVVFGLGVLLVLWGALVFRQLTRMDGGSGGWRELSRRRAEHRARGLADESAAAPQGSPAATRPMRPRLFARAPQPPRPATGDPGRRA